MGKLNGCGGGGYVTIIFKTVVIMVLDRSSDRLVKVLQSTSLSLWTRSFACCQLSLNIISIPGSSSSLMLFTGDDKPYHTIEVHCTTKGAYAPVTQFSRL